MKSNKTLGKRLSQWSKRANKLTNNAASRHIDLVRRNQMILITITVNEKSVTLPPQMSMEDALASLIFYITDWVNSGNIPLTGTGISIEIK